MKTNVPAVVTQRGHKTVAQMKGQREGRLKMHHVRVGRRTTTDEKERDVHCVVVGKRLIIPFLAGGRVRSYSGHTVIPVGEAKGFPSNSLSLWPRMVTPFSYGLKRVFPTYHPFPSAAKASAE